MKIIVCLDDHGGVLFNGRRQSQDRIVRERILELASRNLLWMNAYSAKMFGEHSGIVIAEDFLLQAGKGDFCFLEDTSIYGFEESIEELIVFWWNRVYPVDTYFDFALFPNFNLVKTENIVGSSHETITMEVYQK